jgi:cytochrome c5
MKKSLIILFLTVLTACGTVKLAAPQQSDVNRVSAKYPGYNLAELNDGKTLFQQTCDRCHRLKNPTSRDENKWSEIVPKMIGKLNKKEGKTVIDPQQQESILKYLITMSSAPK